MLFARIDGPNINCSKYNYHTSLSGSLTQIPIYLKMCQRAYDGVLII